MKETDVGDVRKLITFAHSRELEVPAYRWSYQEGSISESLIAMIATSPVLGKAKLNDDYGSIYLLSHGYGADMVLISTIIFFLIFST